MGHRQGGRALQGYGTPRDLPGSTGLSRHHQAAARVREADRHQGHVRDRALREHAREGSAELQRSRRPVDRLGRSRVDRRVRRERLDPAHRQVLRRCCDHRPQPQPERLLPSAARRFRQLGRNHLRPAVRQLFRPSVLQQMHAEGCGLRQAAGDMGRVDEHLCAEADECGQEAIWLRVAVLAGRNPVGRQLHALPVALRRIAARQGLPLEPDECRQPGGPRRTARS